MNSGPEAARDKQFVNLTKEMTMDFAVKDRQALARLTPGQKVNFMVIEQPKGRYVISEISPAK